MDGMKEENKNFAYRMQVILQETGWNLSELARRVMVSPQATQQWSKGVTTARGDRLKRLAAVTGKPTHWFFLPEGNEPSEQELKEHSQLHQLDDKEKALLSLFNQMPEAEKNRLIVHAKTILSELDLLKGDVANIIKDIHK
ncbi:helix-turn-helix domain-containing protein [Salmonella enterica]|uniref:Transcriptional regulator n=2 Tax=Enterobacteriaceae TaxID=543 RepID=A0A5W3IAU3_SALET|nr:helix-turn-helix domain-containing protein [Salmonella enterica]EAA8845593.1 helix-turn-helix domain-containing protein [Salmonella enterica subsp. enterica]EAA9934037.1 helix-turn-helix domain-containing protein [Salmonella enterica subsp. salamae]EBG5099111.1 helix-turn-helix domain-containing protein [Salmonella enterica subsp. enterica serovar India]EBS3868408.1 transcriptional regulator [Salmonella enterica subsp. enterica serovar Kimberley]EBW6494898.1 transcriptional regulator [Salmo